MVGEEKKTSFVQCHVRANLLSFEKFLLLVLRKKKKNSWINKKNKKWNIVGVNAFKMKWKDFFYDNNTISWKGNSYVRCP